MTSQWWTVTLRADGNRYAHINVSAPDEDSAIDSACQIELAPRRSVVSVKIMCRKNDMFHVDCPCGSC
jgi:hypothetical protein